MNFPSLFCSVRNKSGRFDALPKMMPTKPPGESNETCHGYLTGPGTPSNAMFHPSRNRRPDYYWANFISTIHHRWVTHYMVVKDRGMPTEKNISLLLRFRHQTANLPSILDHHSHDSCMNITEIQRSMQKIPKTRGMEGVQSEAKLVILKFVDLENAHQSGPLPVIYI